VAAAEERIWLVSPFLTAPVATALVAATGESPSTQRRLLTNLDPRAVRCGSLDTEALSMLLSAGFRIRSMANLHAKVALVDSNWGLIGSGNLTGAGLGGEGGRGNYEMGTILAPTQFEEASEIVLDWWKRAAEVDAEQIAAYAALPKLPKDPIGSLGPFVEPPRTAKLEEILEEDPATATSRRYWINANYHDPGNEYWWRRNWVSDGGNKSYDVDDLLVIYLGKTNKGPQLCPAVVRVAEVCSYDREFVLAERDLEAADRWPYVTRTSFVAEVPPTMGAPLSLAGKTYLSVENGCELTREEFERLAQALLI
jgi:hypothetical protein